MKIDQGRQAYIQNLNLNKEKPHNKADRDVKKKDSKSVNIDISKSARKLADKIKSSEDGGFSQRVEEIRKAILSNSYSVSSDDIADKIIANINLQADGGKDE